MSIEVMTNVWKYSEHSGTELLLLDKDDVSDMEERLSSYE